MDTRRPQLDWQTLQQVRWLLGGGLALLSAWTAFYMDVEAPVLLLLITIAVPLVTWKPVLATLWPGWSHRLVFPALAAWSAADFYQTHSLLPVMVRLGLALLLYRSVVLRTRREDRQLILLSLFLVVVAGVLTVSPLFVVQILFFTACALALLFVVTLSAAIEEDGRPAPKTGKPAWINVNWRETGQRVLAVLDWRAWVLTGALFLGMVFLSSLFFLAIPRFEMKSGFFLDQLLTGKSRTGFSETVRFGQVVDIQQDHSIALIVDVSDPSKVPADPYWRMLVLDAYREGTFAVSSGLMAEMSSTKGKVTSFAGRADPARETPVWTFYLEKDTSRYLPLVGPFAQIDFADPQTLWVNERSSVVALSANPSKMTAYRVEGMEPASRFEDDQLADRLKEPRPPRRPVEEPGPDEEDYNYWFGEYMPRPPTYLRFRLSESDRDQLRAWVKEIGEPKGGDNIAFAERACAWLNSRHGYSLQMTLPPQEEEGDLLVRWMNSPQPGHCELFAGSLVLLCRAAGVPARMVVGFHGGLWNPNSRSIEVSNAMAHSWCEIFDGDRHWVRADPTPGGGGVSTEKPVSNVSAARMQMAVGWGARLSSLRVAWYRRVVSFDQSSQLNLVRKAGDFVGSGGKRVVAYLDRNLRLAGAWLATPWSVWRLAGAAGLAAAAFFGVWSWRKVDVTSRLRAARGDEAIRREAGRWLVKFNRYGVPSDAPVRARLMRLCYGHRMTWPPVAESFRVARNTLKSHRRHAKR